MKILLRRRRGFALVVALLALAAMTVLLLALLGGATHQTRSAQGDASLAREKLLADTAAALVIGQIRQASTRPGEAWISQPGLLRTYAPGASRLPTACYKLYSAAQRVDTSGTLAFLSTDVPGDWNTPANRSVYTDLNAPIASLFGPVLYPILDPAALEQVTANGKSESRVAGLATDPGHAVEMPVAWLYQLRDGTLGSPAAATAQNPIVGRIAFWTDDETSKIDINTAGEASPWNTPRGFSADDVAWATTAPAEGEYPRYPGHPASVSLSTVFTNLVPGLTPDRVLALTPRYGPGGSDFGTKATSPSHGVAAKSGRLYPSLDEFCFGAGFDGDGARTLNPLGTSAGDVAQAIDMARFVLTAHSHAPETTLLGEPRVAIWPVSDQPDDDTRTTAADRAVAAAATVGTVPYYFQRHNAASATDDLDRAVVPENRALLDRLVATGDESLPGWTGTFARKYPDARWPQLVLETLDAIRGFNAIDPSPAPFVPYAPGDRNGVGRGLIVPLQPQPNENRVRGLGRYPTLWGLTLVLYVSGFQYVDKDGATQTIDYTATPDDATGTSWLANFSFAPPPTSKWSKVNAALVRAFVVPTTFQPGCGFPETSDACDLQITGLDRLTVKLALNGHATTGGFNFPHVVTSPRLSDALKVAPADRAWGGYEGPLAWRAAAAPGAEPYPLAGHDPFVMKLNPRGYLDPTTKGPSSARSWAQQLSVESLPGLTVAIRDAGQHVVQTFTVDLTAATPPLVGHAPTVCGEANRRDGATPDPGWATNPENLVAPSYYMNLQNRIAATKHDRPLMIQAGDMTLGVEVKTDPRLVAALADVPATFFGPAAATVTTTPAGGTHAHDLRFADGTSACWITAQTAELVGPSSSLPTATLDVPDWSDVTQTIHYPWCTQAAPAAPSGAMGVTMTSANGTVGPAGDWDTGPGFAPDGGLVNLPDAGYAGTTLTPEAAYRSLTGGEVGAATRFAPNALLPSAGVFGSLPAGIDPAHPAQSQPWRTLLFCPFPAADGAHPGIVSPPDYLWQDRFWMPVVEPYALSTRMETAGKINLNDEIVPFTYLHRRTALRALLHSVRLPAISPAFAASEKVTAPSPLATFWRTIDEDATVAQIESRFAGGDAYLAESEIDTVPLVPTGVAAATLDRFWNSRGGPGRFTGDNLRELPYAQLLGRLTTRSNSYTVHLRAQVLQKVQDGTPPGVWREGVDRVLADWRGSYEIERDLDPAAKAPARGQPLGPYLYRIVSARRFTP